MGGAVYDPSMIDKSGGRWIGSEFADLATYLREYTRSFSPTEQIQQSVCGCDATNLRLDFDDGEGCAQRHCDSCGQTAFIGDSDEYWDDAEPVVAQCPCGGRSFEVGVAFSLRSDGEVCWITVGGRCVACGALGAFTGWKVDYSPTVQLFAKT